MNDKACELSEIEAQHPDDIQHVFIKQVQNTTFDVHVYFSKTSKESFTDKVIRIIQNDGSSMQPIKK